ncbi:MAG: aminoacyl-tRNA hydrolase [Thermoplasmata archaeon]|nr:aminoacyl-tRNA hydrolase [Thermoplasmata archaeon]
MVLVVRGELRLTPGKVAVQVAHAAVMLSELAAKRPSSGYETWRAEGQKKIALIAANLGEMETLQRAARAKGLATVFVEDAGLTEVPPGTRTVLGIGPGPSEIVDSVTGQLALL